MYINHRHNHTEIKYDYLAYNKIYLNGCFNTVINNATLKCLPAYQTYVIYYN